MPNLTVTDDDAAAGQLMSGGIDGPRGLIMAPDGDEAFDDCSFVVQWHEGDEVVVAAGMIGEEDAPVIVDPVRSIRLSAAEFYGALADAFVCRNPAWGGR